MKAALRAGASGYTGLDGRLVLFSFVVEETFTRVRAALERVINQGRGELPGGCGLAGMQALSGIDNLVGDGEVFGQQFGAKIAL